MKYQKLGQHILQVRGISFKPEDIIKKSLNGYAPIIKSNNITEEGFVSDELIYIKKEYIRQEQFIKNGDLVLTASSGSKKTIGKNIQFDYDYHGSFGAFCKLIRPKETIYAKYLYHFFKTRSFRDTIEKAVQGANIANLKNEYIDDLKIALPPLDDQIRIAAVLTRAEKLIAKRKESIKALDEFLKSTFLEMFGDPVRNEKGWKKEMLKGLSTKFSDGPFGSNLKTCHYEKVGVRVIRLNNIGINKFLNTDKAYISQKYFDDVLKKYSCFPGDVVIGTMGEPNIRACIIPENIEIAVNKADCILCRPNKTKALPQYLTGIMNLSSFLSIASNLFHGQTRTRVSMGQLATLEIPLPPLPLQTQFASIVEKVEAIKAKYTQSLSELEKLYGSLSQRAFKGELDLSRVPLEK